MENTLTQVRASPSQSVCSLCPERLRVRTLSRKGHNAAIVIITAKTVKYNCKSFLCSMALKVTMIVVHAWEKCGGFKLQL